MAMMPVCTGWLTGLRRMMPGRDLFDRIRRRRSRSALAVDRLAERIHHAAEQTFADGHLQQLAGGPDLIALLEARCSRRG